MLIENEQSAISGQQSVFSFFIHNFSFSHLLPFTTYSLQLTAYCFSPGIVFLTDIWKNSMRYFGTF